MKKTLLVLVVALISTTAFSQASSSFGIKAGLNYNGNGDYFNSAEQAFENPDKNAGFHVGFFGKIGNRIYLRPEVVYTSTSSGYDEGDLKIKKLDVPILVGTKVIGPLHVFAGPAFQYLLDTEFDGITFDDVENNFSVGLNIGAGVNLGKFGIDLRYERGFSENEVNFINSNITTLNGDRVDTRPDQLILSFSLKI
ncbi:outer membrane beta-barrel protein [Croceitalea vernalis]|uniref:Outer membrane beta-barrel protein n=1 Tax=Croceitalea vernalis TaxID=3075599 RepID=A0ABU3BIU5_9FLAO|nr:outer membrane beta-barrel protein [Croceitalea sp. P007]MDT0622079.1 outer membrane beta-barrel protein [Croceitalea sp. P007]